MLAEYLPTEMHGHPENGEFWVKQGDWIRWFQYQDKWQFENISCCICKTNGNTTFKVSAKAANPKFYCFKCGTDKGLKI